MDLLAMTENIDFSSDGVPTFWNRASPDCDAHLTEEVPVGAKICASREAAIERVAAVVLNFLTGRAWLVATESRWTNVFTVLRRFVVGVAASKLLVKALEDVRLSLGNDDNLEEALLKIIKQSEQDWSSKNKLRLVRVVKVLCGPEIQWTLAVMACTLAPIELCQYAVRGHEKKTGHFIRLGSPKTFALGHLPRAVAHGGDEFRQ
jgi:hypothetical protein